MAGIIRLNAEELTSASSQLKQQGNELESLIQQIGKSLPRVVSALYSHFEEKQRAQISDLVRIAFTECDGSIRADNHRINFDLITTLHHI